MKVLIVDDEPLARQRLKRLLLAHPHCELAGEAENGQQALQHATALAVDVVLLDIEMPGDDGLTVAAHLAQLTPPPALIFVTAHPQHALAAFQVAPQGYLLKPVGAAALAECLQRLTVSTRAQLEAQKQAEPRLVFRVGQQQRSIALSELCYLQAEDKYVRIVYQQGEAVTEQSLKALEDKFGDLLLRVHRQTLVLRQRVVGLSRNADGTPVVLLRDCLARPEISRREYPLLRQLFQQP